MSCNLQINQESECFLLENYDIFKLLLIALKFHNFYLIPGGLKYSTLSTYLLISNYYKISLFYIKHFFLTKKYHQLYALKLYYINMGICKSKQEKIEANTKSFQNSKQFQDMQFHFSTKSLTQVSANCLILFVDDSCEVTNNQLLQKAGTDIAPEIQQYFQAGLQRQQKELKAGDFFIFQGIDELEFKNICIICLPIWQNKKSVIQQLQQLFKAVFKRLGQLNVQTFVITEMNFQLGFPPNKSAKVFIQSLYKNKNKVKQVYVIFSDQNHRNIYMHALTSFKKQEQIGSSFIDGNASINQSVYF